MADDRAPTGPEKLQFVAEQLAMAPPGQEMLKRRQRAVLDCPYCLRLTRIGDVFCCETLLQAVTAILDAKEQIELTETMDKIMNRHMDRNTDRRRAN